MALKYSLDLDKEADALEKAVQSVLDEGLRTKDILSIDLPKIYNYATRLSIYYYCIREQSFLDFRHAKFNNQKSLHRRLNIC